MEYKMITSQQKVASPPKKVASFLIILDDFLYPQLGDLQLEDGLPGCLGADFLGSPNACSFRFFQGLRCWGESCGAVLVGNQSTGM